MEKENHSYTNRGACEAPPWYEVPVIEKIEVKVESGFAESCDDLENPADPGGSSPKKSLW